MPIMDATRRERLIGVLCVALSALAFGAMAIFGKLAFAAGVPLFTLLMIRFGLASAVMTGVMRMRGHRWPAPRDAGILLAMGGIGYVGQASCYFGALQHASAGLTALLLYLFPAIVTVLSALLHRRAPSAPRLAAVALAFGGTVLTVGGDASGSRLGIALGIGAALIYSIYILVGAEVTRRVAAIPAATVVMLGAAAGATLLAAIDGIALPAGAAAWAALLAIALISTVAAISLFFAGLRRLGAPDASALSTLEPVTTIVLAALFLGETISPAQMAGGVVILAAVLILARAPGAAR
ncbi:MAG: DMT family transporter [Rhodospirillaceae bacterium]|nr:DMT family transporter [Rhodospirillaceae bacterium]